MGYQSFEPGTGSSDSHGKLAALKLPDLTGKRFLDLGCNHGFFCFAALEAGAAEVVGIDRKAANIEAAQERAKMLGVEEKTLRFVNTSWDDFHETGFDVITLLSALHYANDQAAFLRKIADMLTLDGLLILESGIIDNPRNDWTSIIRGKPPRTDIVEYPTEKTMLRMLWESYAPRSGWPSVTQPGDNVPRFVWHCPKKRRMVMLFTEGTRRGKSTFLNPLQIRGLPVVDIDRLITQQLRDGEGRLAESIRASHKVGFINRCYKKIAEDGLLNELADMLVRQLSDPPTFDCPVMVQGAILADETFANLVQQKCEESGMIVWEAKRKS